MWSLQEKLHISKNYQKIPDSEESFDPAAEVGEEYAYRSDASIQHLRQIRSLCILIILTFVISLVTISINWSGRRISTASIALRQEWRSLTDAQKLDYIAAVQCLRRQPSKLGLEQSLYDDFPWVHSHIGDRSHGSASFLAWHRYFIRTYEKSLQVDCDYTGQLPYWDWTLDWEDLTQAPVWHNEYGFGGNGNSSTGETLLDGYCVTNGPFANLEVLYVKNQLSKHCLSRGFVPSDSEEMRNVSQWIQPSAIHRLFEYDDYNSFNLELEESSHLTIPRTIRGDFLLFTAPYDPVFFLHHAQLDRLWSFWQSKSNQRKMQYHGLASFNSTKIASVDDSLSLGGLAPDIRVSEILDTTKSTLAYRYF